MLCRVWIWILAGMKAAPMETGLSLQNPAWVCSPALKGKMGNISCPRSASPPVPHRARLVRERQLTRKQTKNEERV